MCCQHIAILIAEVDWMSPCAGIFCSNLYSFQCTFKTDGFFSHDLNYLCNRVHLRKSGGQEG